MDTKRFHNPQYKKQIQQNRTYRRQAQARPETKIGKVLGFIKIGTRIRQVAAVLVLLILVYLGYFAKFLQIQSITVQGADQSQSQVVNQITADYLRTYQRGLPQKNIFFLNAKKLDDKITSEDLQISSVSEVKRKFFKSLVVKVVQRVPAYTFKKGEDLFILNSDGNISSKATPDEASKYMVVEDTAQDDQFALGEKVLNDTKFAYLTYLKNNFTPQIGQEIGYFEIPGKVSDQIIVNSKKGFKVYFNSKTDPKEYLNRLLTLWTQLTPDQQNRLAYFDLRLTQTAYSCFKSDKCAQ